MRPRFPRSLAPTTAPSRASSWSRAQAPAARRPRSPRCRLRPRSPGHDRVGGAEPRPGRGRRRAGAPFGRPGVVCRRDRWRIRHGYRQGTRHRAREPRVHRPRPLLRRRADPDPETVPAHLCPDHRGDRQRGHAVRHGVGPRQREEVLGHRPRGVSRRRGAGRRAHAEPAARRHDLDRARRAHPGVRGDVVTPSEPGVGCVRRTRPRDRARHARTLGGRARCPRPAPGDARGESAGGSGDQPDSEPRSAIRSRTRSPATTASPTAWPAR